MKQVKRLRLKPQRLLLNMKVEGSHLVSLHTQGKDMFSVTYGQQVNVDLSREQAAIKFGHCIMHALSCAGKLYE